MYSHLVASIYPASITSENKNPQPQNGDQEEKKENIQNCGKRKSASVHPQNISHEYLPHSLSYISRLLAPVAKARSSLYVQFQSCLRALRCVAFLPPTPFLRRALLPDSVASSLARSGRARSAGRRIFGQSAGGRAHVKGVDMCKLHKIEQESPLTWVNAFQRLNVMSEHLGERRS